MVIAISLPSRKTEWQTLSFASTLYLCPILDLLLARVPHELHCELRLGLQEALVNAAKHGNQLDPSKQVSVQFSASKDRYSWVITDQGSGFDPVRTPPEDPKELLPDTFSDHGRGLCLLYQIFDQVHWNERGTQLRLCKYVSC